MRPPWNRRWHWRPIGTAFWPGPWSWSGNRQAPRSGPSDQLSGPSGRPCPTCRFPRPCTRTRRRATPCSTCSWRPPFHCRTVWPCAVCRGFRSKIFNVYYYYQRVKYYVLWHLPDMNCAYLVILCCVSGYFFLFRRVLFIFLSLELTYIK